jgi:hypothetical protein
LCGSRCGAFQVHRVLCGAGSTRTPGSADLLVVVVFVLLLKLVIESIALPEPKG